MKLVFLKLIILLLLICIILVNTEPTYNIVNKDDYEIYEFPNFLAPEECDKIIEMSKNNLFQSKINSLKNDGLDTSIRNSNQCWLDDTRDPVIKKISDLVSENTNTHKNYKEQIQVVRYNKDGFYKPHYDACDGNVKNCKRMNGKNGQRLLTFLIYLNDDFKDGGTFFPNINKTVVPEKGKAVLFYNVDKKGNVINQALHGGNPVSEGTKWVANKWVHFY